MPLLSDQLAAILRDGAFSYADHQKLDGVGHSVGHDSPKWSWVVTVDSEFVDITAHTKQVVDSRDEALKDAAELFDRLAPLVGAMSHTSLGAQNVWDRVNGVVVGWLGAVAIRARWESRP
ncbi:MAG TPA: hypothetical protein VGP16_14035 [Asanoa sp.]|jgi:hypothetical protein|nr:hypothetical protein [Asanoa sp.]